MCYAKTPKLPSNFVEYFPGSTEKVLGPEEALTAPALAKKTADLAKALPVAMNNIALAQDKQKRDYRRRRRYAEVSGQGAPPRSRRVIFAC